ncbi:unnamed protein product [Rhizoctonia solani]|uniref:F-box domain-containing protein n=1 Tax=Rhizoctonia solani TaxID=456999 RepID=A0A8H3BIH3_9AGAM|nr:unnamed protein product [Rhizoctonia solani]
MAKRASTRQTKTRSKRVRKETNSSDDDFQRDTDFVDESETEQQSPPPKRQRTATKTSKAPVRKKQVRGKQDPRVGLVDMPIRVLTEIASQLLPVDIISLARTNKSLRSTLMRRSAINIWHEAMDNVLGLPDCPPDMSEPRYLALSCGKNGKTEIDAILRVRLCGPCRKACLIPWTMKTVPLGIMPLIPFSGSELIVMFSSSRCLRNAIGIAPPPRRANAYVLRDDIPGLVAEHAQKKKLNTPTFQAWAAEKREILSRRLKHARELTDFLHIIDLAREAEIEDTKAERQEEIERRLEELGWTTEDMDFDYPGCTQQREWLDMISQLKVLTERVWSTLQPKLVVLLEANRERRVVVERRQREFERRTCLSEWFGVIKKRDNFTVEFQPHEVATTSTSGSDKAISVSYEEPFPSLAQLLNCPVVLDLYETDAPAAEMEAKFEKHRHTIEIFITEWKSRIQGHFIKLLPKGTKKISIPSQVARNKEPSPLATIRNELKPLLRADNFFSATSLFGHVETSMYESVLRAEDLMGTPPSIGTVWPQEPPSLEHIRWDPEASKIARALVTSIGKANASYLEMTDRAIYACGRCHDTEVMTWENMVRHYVHQQEFYAIIQNDSELSEAGVVCNNAHDLKFRTKDPLVRYSTTQTNDKHDQFVCKLCAKSIDLDEVVASEASMLKHLSAVHGITKPKVNEHYSPQATDLYDSCGSDDRGYDRDYDDGYSSGYDHSSDYDMDPDYSEDGCGYRRSRYKRRGYSRHPYRPRCAYMR